MKLPLNLNLTESEVLSIIDEVVKTLAHSFTFGYYDVDDLIQEGRMFAIDALGRYDSNRGTSLRTFLHNHVRNRFLNLKRDKYIRPIPKNLSEDKTEQWVKKNSVKRSLIDTLDISDERNENSHIEQDSFVNNLHYSEILRIIDVYLPIDFRMDYRRLLEDVKIPKSRRLKLFEKLREIILEHGPREEKGTFE